MSKETTEVKSKIIWLIFTVLYIGGIYKEWELLNTPPLLFEFSGVL